MYACSYCGSSFEQAEILCPTCSGPVTEEAEACPHCGEPLSVVGKVVSRQLDVRPPRWLRVARARASSLRRQDEPHSRLRMEALLEIDRRRLEMAAEGEARRRLRDRQTLMIAAVICAALVGFFAAAALLALWSR
jgi:hypothetical protein